MINKVCTFFINLSETYFYILAIFNSFLKLLVIFNLQLYYNSLNNMCSNYYSKGALHGVSLSTPTFYHPLICLAYYCLAH